MRNEQLEIRNVKNCTDCLHCKVSVRSLQKFRLCFVRRKKQKKLIMNYFGVKSQSVKNLWI